MDDLSIKPKDKDKFNTPYKYVKSKKDKIYNKQRPVKVETEQERIKLEGRY